MHSEEIEDSDDGPDKLVNDSIISNLATNEDIKYNLLPSFMLKKIQN